MSTFFTIDFSYNWNGKLFLDNFGTVRLYNESKYAIGTEMEVTLRGVSFGYAKVIAARGFRYNQIRDVLAFLDMGKPSHYMGTVIKSMYEKKINLSPDTMFHHVVLHYTQRNIENQQTALKMWWDDILLKTKTAV